MNSKNSTTSTDLDAMNSINKLLNNTKNNETKNIILNFLQVLLYTINEMRDEFAQIEGIHTAVDTELFAVVMIEVLEHGIDMPDYSIK